MPSKPEIGSRVKLKTFLGESHPPKDCDPRENYWKLIGQAGQVIEDIPQSDRVLVVFENSLSAFGLHCHNPIPNSLRIKWSDLEIA